MGLENVCSKYGRNVVKGGLWDAWTKYGIF